MASSLPALLQRSVKQAPDEENIPYEDQSFSIVTMPDEIKQEWEPLIAELWQLLPLTYKDETNVDISPLFHSLSMKTTEVAHEVAKVPFPKANVVPLPSTFFMDTGDWRLGRNHKGTADFIALVALAPLTIQYFAFTSKQHDEWIDMTYGKNATLFNGNSNATMLHFTKKVAKMFDENMQFCQTQKLNVGEIFFCHTAMPWKLIDVDEKNPALVHCIHFANNPDLNMHRAQWKKAWQQGGYINPAVDFGGLCHHLRIQDMEQCAEPRHIVPTEYVNPAWVPEEQPRSEWDKFVLRRDSLISQNAAAWNNDWESGVRSHNPGTKLFQTAMQKLNDRLDKMFAHLNLLNKEQKALADVRSTLDEVPYSVRDGNLLKSWNRLNRIHGELSGKLISWIYDGKEKGSELLSETQEFTKKFAVKINLRPYVDRSKKELMVSVTEAKMILTETAKLQTAVFNNVKRMLDSATRESFALMRAHMDNLYKNIEAHHANSAYMYDVSVCQGIKEYLQQLDIIIKEAKAEEEDEEDEDNNSGKEDDDDDDDDDDEDDDEGIFSSIVPSIFVRGTVFETGKKTGTCFECEKKAMIYKKGAICNRCVSQKLTEAAKSCAAMMRNMKIEAAKVICTAIHSNLDTLAKEVAGGSDGNLKEFSQSIFTQIDELKTHYTDEDEDQLEMEEEYDDSAVVSDNDSIEYDDDDDDEDEDSGSSEKKASKKRNRSDEDRNAVAHEMVMAMAHTPVASTLKPTILAYRDGKYDFIKNAVKMLKLQPVLYAVVYPSGEWKEMFLTEEEAHKECRPDQKVVAVKQEERWPMK